MFHGIGNSECRILNNGSIAPSIGYTDRNVLNSKMINRR